jgi:hypothetical protein
MLFQLVRTIQRKLVLLLLIMMLRMMMMMLVSLIRIRIAAIVIFVTVMVVTVVDFLYSTQGEVCFWSWSSPGKRIIVIIVVALVSTIID